MATLDVRPDSVDVFAYAGDTLTISIVAPSGLVEGLQWDAQVRSAYESTVVEASFEVTPPTVENGPATLILPSEVTAVLGTAGRRVRVGRGADTHMVTRFVGVWDCQVSAAGDDPVRTLVQGKLTIDADVTRLVAP